MDKERIVGSSSHWEDIKQIFHNLGLTISTKIYTREYVSHGIIPIFEDKGIFLQMNNTFEYRSILHGQYTGAKLYHYLSLISNDERNLLLEEPYVQWRKIYRFRNMPKFMWHKMKILQLYLPTLYNLIPYKPLYIENINHEYEGFLLTIPRGRSQPGENSKLTACRELFEETGIIANPDDLREPFIDTHTGTDGNIYTTIIYPLFLKEMPQIKTSREFKGYMTLSSNDDILMMRYSRILNTFLNNINHVAV